MCNSRTEHGRLAIELAAERDRLVGLCARLTGDVGAAEDLAQETLAEAWRLLAKLHMPEGCAPWLVAIARNICMRWARRRGRDLKHRMPLAPGVDGDAVLDSLPNGEDDISFALERGELAGLLDRALALLPAQTRKALVASYVHELPQAELAARLGLSEGALRVRLHRGRLALRHLLATDLRVEALALGMRVPETPTWQETRIWCPFCGRHRLRCRIDRHTSEFSFRCSGACGPVIGRAHAPELLAQLASPKSILTRHLLALETYYRRILADGGVNCPDCGHQLPVRYPWRHEDHLPPGASELWLGVYAFCPLCSEVCDSATPWHLTLDTTAAQRFWRRHPRMRALPTQELDYAGRPALLTGFESLEGLARVELIQARDTYEILHVSGEDKR